MSRVLLTGSDGYLGAPVADALLSAGHDVVGVDTGFYLDGWLDVGPLRLAPTTRRDIRDLTETDLAGFDAVVHLAELSNDPLGALDPEVTVAINHAGSTRLARLARSAGVARFVYASSCSVYGVAEGLVDESSPVDPQTAYARCKVLVEDELRGLAGDGFSPVLLRNATAYGASPRMRFDIVLNNLAGMAHTTRRLVLTSDGAPWRPLVHVADLAAAVRCAVEAPREAVHGETFNVGSATQNYRVRDIAEIVSATFPGCTLETGPPGPDQRSYRVDFAKIEAGLPGFACAWDAERGARQLRDVFEAVGLDEEVFTGRGHTRLAQLQHLRDTGALDAGLRWTPAPVAAR